MRTELRDKIIELLDRAFRLVGEPGFDEGMRKGKVMLAALSQRAEEVPDREGLIRELDLAPDPGRAEERMILGSMRFLPHVMRYAIKRLAKAAERDLPSPPAGRNVVPQQERAKIVAFIGDLHTRGTSLSNSKKRAAERFGLGISTVERMWLDRSTIQEVDFRSALRWWSDLAENH